MTRAQQADLPADGMAAADLLHDMPADDMARRAAEAAAFLKALSHEGRLMILCHLSAGEKSVTALEDLLSVRQAAVSQHLARLRSEGLVAARRDGKAIYYAIKDPKVRAMIALVYEMFCGADLPTD